MKRVQDSYFYDIDAARSGVMFVALIIHSGAVYGVERTNVTNNVDRSPIFTFIVEGLHLFISPTFFIVGGFFTALLMLRYGVVQFVLKRFLRAGVPLITIALTLNVVECYLRYAHGIGEAVSLDNFFSYFGSDGFVDVWRSGQWQLHTWFLVQLLLSFAAATIVFVIYRGLSLPFQPVIGLIDTIGRHAQSNLGFFVLVLLLPLLQIGVLFVCSVIPSSYMFFGIGDVGISSLYRYLFYFTYFAFGSAMFMSSALYGAVLKWRPFMPYAALLAFCIQFYPDDTISQGINSNVVMWLHFLFKWTLILFMLQFFHKHFAEKPRGITAVLSDASMTFFLVHHGCVYFIGSLLVLVSWPIGLEWLLLVVITATIALSFHLFVVSNSRVLRFIINGQTRWRAVSLKSES